jgi:hypothetical protein
MRILTRRDTGLISQWTFGRQVISYIGLDPDASAFLTAAGITNSTIINAINILVLDLKLNGLWNKMSAIYPFVGGTAATHKFNLKNPLDTNAAFRLSFVGGWTHSATGALPNGTNAYADTFLVPNISLLLNSTQISFYSRTNSSSGTMVDISVSDIVLYLASGYAGSGVISNNNNSGFIGAIANSDSRGFYCSSRTANTTWVLYRNNVNIANRTTAANALSLNKILLSSTTGFQDFSNKEQAFTSIGQGLSAAEVSNLYTAVQTFQTTLGRQV